MPYHGPVVGVPSAFSLPDASTDADPDPFFNEQAVSFRIPALPNPSCVWLSAVFWMEGIYPDIDSINTGMRSTENPLLSTFHSFTIYEHSGSLGAYNVKGVTENITSGFMILPLNTNKLVARDIVYWFGNTGVAKEVTNLYAQFYYDPGCEPLPDGGGGGDDDDDDDDDDGPGASGQYRAIDADSVRGWLHFGQENVIRSLHTLPMTAAFSGAYSATKWVDFRANPRQGGVLAALGRMATGTNSRVYLSTDGGQSLQEVLSVDGTSVRIEYDTEREWLVVLKEGTPVDPDDDTSHGIVSRLISRDFGQNFTNMGNVSLSGSDLRARLLGLTYDPRQGGTLYLLCKILGVTKILASTDGGASWEVRYT